MRNEDAKSSLQATFTDLLWVHVVALGAMAIADSALVVARAGGSIATASLYATSSFASASWLALALTAVATPVLLPLFALGRVRGLGQRRATIVGWLVATQLVAAACLLLLKPWDLFESWPYWFFPTVGAAAGVALSLVSRAKSPRLLTGFLLLVAVTAFSLDAFAFRRLYLRLHVVLFFVTAVSGAAALWPHRRRWRERWSRRLLVLVLASHGALVFDLTAVRFLGEQHGVVQPKVLGFLHAVVDADRDGHSAVFGGGDCDDFNPKKRPGACEVPDNHIDDNCNGLVDGASIERAQDDPSPASPLAAGARPDIYFVLVDTLRADYGERGSLGKASLARARIAPELDVFATKTLDFSQAYTPYPSTYRAMISTMQSRWWRNVDPDAVLLLEWLRTLGYDTRIWIANKRLVERDGERALIGFDRARQDPFSIDHKEQKTTWSETMVDEALAELERPDDPPRFRWLHFLDPHSPLLRGEGAAVERYTEEVRHVSRIFGKLVSGLERSERGRRAVVILMSDHGDEFDDHGARFHGATVYQEVVLVPLLMRLPGVSPHRIDAPATLLDIVPTLAAYLGQPRASSWQGVAWLGPAPKERRVFTQIEPVHGLGGQGRPEMHAVIGGQYKLIFNVTANLYEFYALDTDPLEQHSLANQYGQAPFLSLVETLSRWQDAGNCQAF